MSTYRGPPQAQDRYETWSPQALRRMDDAFRRRLLRAIAKGKERAPVGVVTEPCTRLPHTIRPDAETVVQGVSAIGAIAAGETVQQRHERHRRNSVRNARRRVNGR